MPFLIIQFISALFISGVAAWFSIAGLMAVFPGAKIAVMLMGLSLEAGKLTATSWLYRHWKKSAKMLRTYLILAVMILSLVTSIGIFGYLSKAHIEGTQGISLGIDSIELVDTQIKNEEAYLKSLNTSLSQIDRSVDALITSDKITSATTIRNRARIERASITKEIALENAKVLTLKQQRAMLSSTQRIKETDVGPIKYFAQFVFAKDDTETIDKTVRYLIVLLIFVFDPLAILLLVAANVHMKDLRSIKTSEDNIHIIEPDDLEKIT